MKQIKSSRVAFFGVLALVGLVTFIAPSLTQGQGSPPSPLPPRLNVNVVNSPANPVPVTGTVNIGNLGNNVLPVRDIDNPALQPVTIQHSVSFNTPGEFRFITPIAPNVHDSRADFDDGILPYLTVKVCRVAASECLLIKTFTSRGSMAEQLRIESKPREGSWFVANWDTHSSLDNTAVYRISVDVPGETLGSIDLPPSVYLSWGRTWPIKFIVEKDPELRIRLLAAAGSTIWDVADILRSELGICDDELSELLLSTYPNATAAQVEQVVNGVCQDVILPSTTKISDAATRDALTLFDMTTGEMIFAYETPLLKNLKIDDVLVSKPSAAAPFGYLRKVTSIRKDKGVYMIESIQASLTDTIVEGSLDAGGELLPGDELPAEPVAANSAFRSTDLLSADPTPQSASTLSSACVDSSGSTGYHFECSVDETFDFERGEGEFAGTGHVRVAGKVFFNAGYDVGVGVEFCARFPVPACLDRFEARLRVQQRSELHIEGALDATLQKEIVVARKFFKPITFWIGPVPVVIFPVANLIVGARGDAHVSFSFDAWAEGSFAIGAKWADDGQGWRNVSEHLSLFGDADASLEGSMELRGYYKGSAKMLLYGVAGPSFEAALGGRAHFQIPGNPVWSIHGRIDGELAFEVSIIDVISLGRFSLEEFLVKEIELDRSANFVPRCTASQDLITVNISSIVRLGPISQGGSGYFDCTDPEGDRIDYEFKTDRIGFEPNDTFLSDNRVQFGQPFDLHRITVIATDASGGAAPPFTLAFNVINPPPDVEVTVATDTVPVGVQYFINALAYDPDQGAYLDCIRESPTGVQVRFDFFVDEPNTVRKIGDGFNCSAEVIFQQTGTQTITVEAFDRFGASDKKIVNVNVTPAPSNPPPVIDVSSISFRAIASKSFLLEAGATIYVCTTGQVCPVPNGADVAGGPSSFPALYEQPFYLSLSASDADGTTPTVTWFCRNSFNTVTLATPVGGGVYSCGTFGPAQTVFIGATVSDGVTTVFSEIRTYRMTPLSNPN